MATLVGLRHISPQNQKKNKKTINQIHLIKYIMK